MEEAYAVDEKSLCLVWAVLEVVKEAEETVHLWSLLLKLRPSQFINQEGISVQIPVTEISECQKTVMLQLIFLKKIWFSIF